MCSAVLNQAPELFTAALPESVRAPPFFTLHLRATDPRMCIYQRRRARSSPLSQVYDGGTMVSHLCLCVF